MAKDDVAALIKSDRESSSSTGDVELASGGNGWTVKKEALAPPNGVFPGNFEKKDRVTANKAFRDRFTNLSGFATKLGLLVGTDGQPAGIKNEEEAQRREDLGDNAVKKAPVPSYFELLWEAAQDFIMIMLMVSAAVQLILAGAVKHCGHGIEKGWMEPFAIMISVLVVTNVTAGSDWLQAVSLNASAEEADSKKSCVVIRDKGKGRGPEQFSIHPDKVVVGDYGNMSPADGICIESNDLTLDETALTGEPVGMRKSPPGADNDVDPWIFGQTKITQGAGKMIVMACGEDTCVGKINKTIEDDVVEGSELTKKLDDMVHDISFLGIVISLGTGVAMIIIWAILHFGYGMVADEATNTPAFWADKSGSKNKWDSDTDVDFLVDVFVTVVTILVVAIPEGLPLAVTLSLAYSVSKMDDKEAGQFNQVKKIDCAETMGSATTICTDKTGTLTENKMVVVQFVAAGQEAIKRKDDKEGIKEGLEKANFSQKFIDLITASCAINSGNKSHLQYLVEPDEIGVTATAGSSSGWWIQICNEGIDSGKWQYFSTDMPLEEGEASVKWTTAKDEAQAKIDFKFLQAYTSGPNKGQLRNWKAVDGANPTECALLGMLYQSGVDYVAVRKQDEFQGGDAEMKIGRNYDEVLKFTSVIKMMAWAVPLENGGTRLFVKGAGEVVLAKSVKYLQSDGVTTPDLDEQMSSSIEATLGQFADSALRTISLAYRDFSAEEKAPFDKKSPLSSEDWGAEYISGLTLIGITGIQDPLKDGVKWAIDKCFRAGIDVRMITGDNLRTAVAIALDAGILQEEHFDHVDRLHAMNTEMKYDDYFGMLQQHQKLEAIETRMLADGIEEKNIDRFLELMETCRGNEDMFDQNEDGTTTFVPDRVKSLRKDVAMTGKDFALKVHAKYYAVGHVKTDEGVAMFGTAPDLSYGKAVSSWKESCEEKYGFQHSLPDGVNQEVLDDVWPRLRVMARCHPDDKLTLVAGLMESHVYENTNMLLKLEGEGIKVYPDNQVVAVTGDGTNDAQALSRANVGFAMGIAGTEVARDACDIIIKDDNFKSVVVSVMWGRNVYDSVAKFLQFQLTVNVVAVICACLGAVIYQASPLGAVQMLWVNLVMDSLGSLALATEAPKEILLERQPYGRNMSMIQRPMKCNIVGQSIWQLAIVLFIMFYGEKFFYYGADRSDQDNAKDGSSELISGRASGCDATQHYTILFNSFVMMTLCNQIASRKLMNEYNLFEGITENKIFLGIMFCELVGQIIFVQFAGNFAECYVDGLTGRQWAWCLGFGMSVWPVQVLISFVANHTKGDPEIEMAKDRTEKAIMASRKQTDHREPDFVDKINMSRSKSHTRLYQSAMAKKMSKKSTRAHDEKLSKSMTVHRAANRPAAAAGVSAQAQQM